MIGTEVYATVSSEEQVQYLTTTFNIPRNTICDSKNVLFEDVVLRETSGKGVDVVLNSLTGELFHATWHVVAKFGNFIEIGQTDLVGAGKLDLDGFVQNRSFSCVDTDLVRSERPAVINQ